MKKLYSVLAFFAVSLYAMGQFTGSGTAADPYTGGTLGSSLSWSPSSDTVYISGDITIGNSGHLTISQGVFVKFLTAGADIFVTGTGRLTADGTASERITFTADHDKDKSHGEAGETWGHISFQSMGAAGASIFDNCIFEYGYNTGAGVAGYGGALHLAFTNVTVSNSIFRNNRAEWGGALFVNQNFSPVIRNCYVYNNKSTRGGGGFYFWNGSGSVIENCIFDSNHVLEPTVPYYTGGGLAGQSNTSIKIVNCTFVNNTSTRTEGQALLLHSSPNARVVNSVFWGSSKDIYLYGTTANVIINSAYQGITYSTGAPVNSLVLNASNTAVDGPNFVATNGSDWSIKYISPMRDAGVNSYPGVTIPATDYNGNGRVSTYDIGAFEVQYSLWKTSAGSTDWSTAANWEGGVPTATSDIFIPTGATNYPTGSSAPNVTIGSGKMFIMEPGSRATVGILTNGGTLQLLANSTDFASLILSSYTRAAGGSEEIQLYLSGGGNESEDNFKWHYISSPVTTLSTNIFTAVTLDLAQYVESRPTLSLRQGWVAYDGYVYSTGVTNGPTFNTLTTGSTGKGYNYWHSADITYTLSGLFNTSTVNASLGFSGNAALHGFNLLGNPFISGLDWDYIVSDAGYPANTSKGVYFTRDNLQCTYIGGVGIPGDVTGVIPPMQGFFTKTYATGNTISLPTAARTHMGIHPRYKSSVKSVIPLVRLSLEGSDATDETVVRFDALAKPGLDNDFDAVKLYPTEIKTYIYSLTDNVKYAINGQPFPEGLMEIPLVLNVRSTGNHTLSASQLQGLDNYQVKLKDNEINVITNFKRTADYTFSAEEGIISGRFVLLIADLATGTEDTRLSDQQFNIYQSGGNINIMPLNDKWDGKEALVTIIDLSGRVIGSSTINELMSGSLSSVPSTAGQGIYFIEIRAGLQRYTGKVIIK